MVPHEAPPKLQPAGRVALVVCVEMPQPLHVFCTDSDTGNETSDEHSPPAMLRDAAAPDDDPGTKRTSLPYGPDDSDSTDVLGAQTPVVTVAVWLAASRAVTVSCTPVVASVNTPPRRRGEPCCSVRLEDASSRWTNTAFVWSAASWLSYPLPDVRRDTVYLDDPKST